MDLLLHLARQDANLVDISMSIHKKKCGNKT